MISLTSQRAFVSWMTSSGWRMRRGGLLDVDDTLTMLLTSPGNGDTGHDGHDSSSLGPRSPPPRPKIPS